MNKRELIDTVAEASGESKASAERVVDATFEAVASALQGGDSVSVPGFGTFEVRERSARTGRNPQTGEQIDIAASKGAGFKPASALKNRLNG